jgi:hypothetical protein
VVVVDATVVVGATVAVVDEGSARVVATVGSGGWGAVDGSTSPSAEQAARTKANVIKTRRMVREDMPGFGQYRATTQSGNTAGRAVIS